jgi:hypothetical protein
LVLLSFATLSASNSALVGKRRGPAFLTGFFTAFLTTFLALFFAGTAFVDFFAGDLAGLFLLLAFLGARDTGTK